MIPSDHFVRFYNEVFKYLDEQNGLEEYYLHISRHQEFHCLEEFSSRKLQGVYDYYVKIRKEENCGMDLEFCDGGLKLDMKHCPSLSKAIDNDAGVCSKYCLHCPGWTMPLYTKAGLYKITNLYALDEPRCTTWLFEDIESAAKKYEELVRNGSPDMIKKNF